MGYNHFAATILEEVRQCALTVNGADVEQTVRLLKQADRVFCDGKGRSGLQLASFAMRLAQMGSTAYIVSESTTPAIKQGDLLVVCSGSGSSQELLLHTQIALSLGAKTIVITGNPHAKVLTGAAQAILIDAPQKQEAGSGSIQPMGTLFEQTLSIVLDTIVLLMMEELSLTGREMFENHRNLE